MNNKLFVGDLPSYVDDETLRRAFSEIGTVIHAEVIRCRKTGQSRCFGFVEMSSIEEARVAISEFDRGFIGEQEICVMEARPLLNRRGKMLDQQALSEHQLPSQQE